MIKLIDVEKQRIYIFDFVILWVTNPIHNKRAMYAVVDKDTIKNEIHPHLSVAKHGFVTQGNLVEIVNTILYKLKTGYQWEYLLE